jgi:hypothetical protein
MLGNFCDIRDMKKPGREPGKFIFIPFFQCFSLVAGEGLEPPTSGL